MKLYKGWEPHHDDTKGWAPRRDAYGYSSESEQRVRLWCDRWNAIRVLRDKGKL